MKSLILLSCLAVITLLAEVFNWRKWMITLAGGGLLIASIMPFSEWNSTPIALLHNMLRFDHYALLFSSLLSVLVFIWFLQAKELVGNEAHVSDHLSLIIFALSG